MGKNTKSFNSENDFASIEALRVRKIKQNSFVCV